MEMNTDSLDLVAYLAPMAHIPKNKTVVVGMSGGVDSSVSALVLKLAGFNVIGLFMKNWEEETDGQCTAAQDYKDVSLVCEKIGIPYYAVNFAEEYREQVFSHFVEEYKKGHTPNPDILCNKEIKFKVFYQKAMELGADYLATGHYCQKKQTDDGQSYLAKGQDSGKDQSYFLYAIEEAVLKNVLFPIGHLEKTQVRQLAQAYDLITHNKKDSTGICFIGERDFQAFLSRYIKGQKGDFINLETNKVLGPHEGSSFYTIGQRKGLGLGGPGGPWYVAKKDMDTNAVYVVEGEEHPALYAPYLMANQVHFITQTPKYPFRCKAKIRYRQQDVDCVVDLLENGSLLVKFDNPQRAISVGQSVVFYLENICLGGAVIFSCAPSLFETQKH